jgi:hypothetical protein
MRRPKGKSATGLHRIWSAAKLRSISDSIPATRVTCKSTAKSAASSRRGRADAGLVATATDTIAEHRPIARLSGLDVETITMIENEVRLLASCPRRRSTDDSSGRSG